MGKSKRSLVQQAVCDAVLRQSVAVMPQNRAVWIGDCNSAFRKLSPRKPEGCRQKVGGVQAETRIRSRSPMFLNECGTSNARKSVGHFSVRHCAAETGSR